MSRIRLSLTPNAERDFAALPVSHRRDIARALLNPTQLELKPVRGRDGLWQIRIHDWRLPTTRDGQHLVVLRIAARAKVHEFYLSYRKCGPMRRCEKCVPLNESVIGAFARGETTGGMLESLEERWDTKLAQAVEKSNSIGDQVRELRQSVEELELSSIEAESSHTGVLDGIRDEFLSLLQLVEVRVSQLESRQGGTLWRRLCAGLTVLLPTWLTSPIHQAPRG